MEQRKQVFLIGCGAPEPAADPATIGFKAYNLWRMERAGLRVPPAFVLGTGFCAEYLRRPGALSQEMKDALAAGIRRLESASGLVFGGSKRPLLVSVRSGAPVSMPGMMETMLNVGLNDASLRGLVRATGNPRLAWDTYRRLIQSFAEIVARAPRRPYEARLAEAVAKAGAADARELDFQALRGLAGDYRQLYQEQAGQPFPQSPMAQLEAAVRAVFESWEGEKAAEYRRMHAIDAALGTAATVQRMVYGNAGGTSGAGVGFTRDPASGKNAVYLDFRFNAQGEDVVSGRHAADGRLDLLPGLEEEIGRTARRLEAEFRDVQEFEFTVEENALYLLQTRSGKRTPAAALRIAVEQVEEGLIAPEEALARLEGIDLAHLAVPRLAPQPGARPLAQAVPAGIGCVSGPLALDTAAAQKYAAAGKPPILVREDAATADLAGIAVCAGLLTAAGSRTSHAAVVARQLGKACLVGCDSLVIDLDNRRCRIGGQWLKEGQTLSLDCDSGRVFAGEVKVVTERPEEYLRIVEGWRRRS